MAESERPLLSSGAEPRAKGKAKPGRLRWVLAAAMVAVVGGFGWVAWSAYKSGGTGIDGIVPLIKADNEPTRVRPDNPGGMPVPNQDKSIYDKLDPRRAPPKGVERLLPSPEAPVARPPATVMPSPEQGKPAIPTLGESAPAPAREVGTAVVKAAPEPPAPTAKEQAAAAAPSPFVKLEAPPAQPKTAPTKDTAPKAPPAQVASTAAKPSTAAGGPRVQLGAVGSEEAAQKEWDRIRKANSDILGSISPSFVRADLGDKGVVYRIQAGPLATADAAADLCSKLKTRNVGCFVAR